MELRKIQGEFETEDLAELAAGRIRRTVRGVRHASVHKIGGAVESLTDRQRYTMLPANMRMMNYATAVMISDISDDTVPEPMQRRNAELIVICDEGTADAAEGIMQAVGALHVRKV